MVRAAEAGLDRSGGGSGSMLHSLMPGQMSYLEVDETVAATARYHLQVGTTLLVTPTRETEGIP